MGIGASSFTMEALVEMQIVLEEKPHITLLIFLCIIQSSVMPLSLSCIPFSFYSLGGAITSNLFTFL